MRPGKRTATRRHGTVVAPVPPPKTPQTPAEWQEAVDCAAAARALLDCSLYGLIKGGPKINADACDRMLAAGSARNIFPSQPAAALATELARVWNAQVAKNRAERSTEEKEPAQQ